MSPPTVVDFTFGIPQLKWTTTDADVHWVTTAIIFTWTTGVVRGTAGPGG